MSPTTRIFLNKRLLATNFRMTHLLTVHTLYPRVIARLRALSTLMTFGITVAAYDLTLICAVLCKVTLLA